MKRFQKVASACLSLLLAAGLCLGRQTAPTASDLKEQILTLEAVDRDPATDPEVRAMNRRLLNDRRSQLQTLMKKRADALRNYLASVKTAITPEEQKAIEGNIRELDLDIQRLERDVNEPAAPASASAPQPAAAVPGRARIAAAAPPPAAPAAPPQTCDGTANSYTDAPALLTDVTDRVAEAIVTGDQTAEAILSATFNRMLFYTVADAVAPAETAARAQSIRGLKAYQYLGETARTDKQIGAAPKASGSTSAIEKPGFARLLGLAVENGAILQEVSGTSLTLSTSPYVLATFNRGGDTAENYQRAGLLNRLGVFATFKLNENDGNVLASARRNRLEQWSVKTRLYGDRSTRTKEFQQFWFNEVQPAIEERLVSLNSVNVFFDDPRFDPLTGTEDALRGQLTALVGGARYAGLDAAGRKAAVKNLLLCYMKANLNAPVRAGTISISAEDRDKINGDYVSALGKSLQNLEVVRGILDRRLADINAGPLATLSYVNHRQASGSDYSELKFLYEQDTTPLRPLKLVANVGASFYHHPNGALNQQGTRDITAALSFEGSTPSPFLRNLRDTPDMSKLTYAFTGSYQRTLENRGVAGKKADIGSAQFKLDIPVFAGVSLPFAVTYSNASEQNKKDFLRTNFGLKFDMDKLVAISNVLNGK